MAVRFKVIASGKLAELGNVGVPYTLYTVASGKSAIVSAMRFCNTHIEVVPFSVGLVHVNVPPPLASSIYIIPVDYPLAAGMLLLDENELTLGAGDSIRAAVGTLGVNNPTYAYKIHFVISGIERDV